MRGPFFKKLERFFLKIIIFSLIILVSVQILRQNDKSFQKLQEIEYAFKNFFQQGQEVITVGDFNLEQGFIVINLVQNISLPQVRLKKNEKYVADFSKGYVEIKVKAGDVISLDTKYYPQPLWFEITFLSPTILTWQTGEQFRIFKEEKRIGVVRFHDKL